MGSWRVKVVLKKEAPHEEVEVLEKNEENLVEIEIKEEIGEDPLGGEEEDHDDLKETKDTPEQEPRKKWSRRKPKMSREEYLRRKREHERLKREAETPEQYTERRQRDREAKRKYRAKQNEQKLLEKKRREELDPRTEEEKRELKKLEKYLYNHARYYKNGRVKDLTEEEKDQRRQENRQRYRAKREQVRAATKEKREEFRQHENAKRRRYYDKKKTERPEQFAEFREKQNACSRKLYENATPEQRRGQVWKNKASGAKFRLKRKLKKEGLPEEEIERRCEELRVSMWKEFDPEMKVRPAKKSS